MTLTECYKILGITPAATPPEIKSAYRKLAKQYHPDKNPNNKFAADQFRLITEAYQQITNPKKNNRSKTYYQTKQQGQKKHTRSKKDHQYKKHSTPPLSDDERKTTRKYVIIVSLFGIAIIAFAYFSQYIPKEHSTKPIPFEPIYTNEPSPAAVIPENSPGISPYLSYFGEGLISDKPGNTIVISNSDSLDAVAFLYIKKGGQLRFAQHEYIPKSQSHGIAHLPDGNYLLNVYFGKNWEKELVFKNSLIKGGFKEHFTFVSYSKPEQLIDLNNKTNSLGKKYSVCELDISPTDTNLFKILTPHDFFGR